ncbi:MAG: C39 family peptidase, partial [Candidatus Dormibacteraeota bacterium]|nr:C39 family peptidase [Candidatus Dormibacteraeota bacterium]
MQIGRPVKVLILAVVVVGSAAGGLALRHALVGAASTPDLSKLPPVTEVSPSPAPSPTAALTPTPSPSPTPLPAALRLGVPFTTQAPNGDWTRHQESCEEATLLMVDAYWKGNRASTLDTNAAEKGITDMVAWQVRNWGSEDDLTNKRLGELAAQYLGYQYDVQPMSEVAMKASIANGIPVVLGVTTHGLGNPRYPNFQSHHLVPGY